MPSLKISFLNVGHGDFVYATTPLGDNLVIDAGSGEVVPSQFLRNVSTISELQVSHPHTDHFDDIIGLATKTIKSFRCPSLTGFTDQEIGWKKSDKAKVAKLRQMKNALPVDNDAVSVGNGFVHTVWHPQNVDTDDPNTASIVTTLSYMGTKVLFGGDLPSSGWESLLKNKDFINEISGTTIFKVPHHGRAEGCCDALFEYIQPMLCIISDKSIEKDNGNTASTAWYSARSAGCNVVGSTVQRKVLSTRSDGSIFLSIDDKGDWRVYPNTKWLKD